MNKHEDRKSPGVEAKAALQWPRLCFEAEARAEARELLHLPYLRRKLEAGDRVSFELGEGADGPPYAIDVRLIEPE